MTQSKKLGALIQKAYDNGWDVFNDPEDGYFIGEDKLHDWKGYEIADNLFVICNHHRTCANDFIFNHDFARALIGNGPNCAYCGIPPHNMHPTPCVEGSNIWPYLWEYHLQQAVISPNPIDCLYKAVFNA